MLQSFRSRLNLIVGLGVFALSTGMLGVPAPPTEPWTDAQLISVEDLYKQLKGPRSAKPLIVCVGFRALYDEGHVPTAVFYGAASKPDGLQELKRQVQGLPRNKEIILYCGCCPWDQCPNIRPAFTALKEMGFKRIRLLHLPASFAIDWAGKGYPYERGR